MTNKELYLRWGACTRMLKPQLLCLRTVQASGDIALGCSDVSVLVGGGDPRAVSLAYLSLEGVAPASADLLILGWYSMAKVGGLWMWPGEYVLASIAMVAHKLS